MIIIIIITNNAIIIGGIGLPDRDYYFDEDKQEKRSKYVEYIAFILHQLGQHDTDKYSRYKDIMICQEIAQTIFEFEKKTKLAQGANEHNFSEPVFIFLVKIFS